MPNMIEGRFRHGSVVIRNKLFVFGNFGGKGSKSCKVFDSNSKNFVMITLFPNTLTFYLINVANTFSFRNKLITIGRKLSTVLYYDVEKDEWSEEIFNLTNYKYCFGSTFIPHIKF